MVPMDTMLALQALPVGVILVWSGWMKVADRLASARAGRTTLPRLVGAHRAASAYRVTGVLELVIGAALLVPARWWWEPAATSALAAGFLGFLGYSKLAAPESSCGCLGSAAAPVSARSFLRAGLLLAAGCSLFLAGSGWAAASADRPLAGMVVVLAELAAFAGLSPELDRWWLLPSRRLWVRVTHPLAGQPVHTPLASTVRQLLHSPAYRSVGAVLRSDVREHWDEGEWRFVTYAVAHGNGPATAVFAVSLLRYDPESVRVAIVDEATGATLYRLDTALAS